MAEARKKLNILIPAYTLGEELFSAISHGTGALLSMAALALMLLRAQGALPTATAALFGGSMVLLYTISCVYHALAHHLEGKKVLRVIDHCSVFLLVLGTYVPASLLGVGGALGWALLGTVFAFAATGIVLTAVKVDGFKVFSVVCHLVCGWSILLGIGKLYDAVGTPGILWLVLGGVMYTVGSILYGVGTRRKYMHCVFHVFCMLGTFCHFWLVYQYLL